PGVGPKSARRIMQARRYGKLDFSALKKMGVVLKRAHYFITCNGKMMYHTPIEETYITHQLEDTGRKENWQIQHENTVRQMSLFTDFHLQQS
ncbi:MAG: radical SAM protein, partial [Lachnospiraceae bacterium]|nr:radical SAM protein [Lachnospiraceae bacterium]